MTEKVKVTQKQADWLERYELTQEQIDWYIDIQPYKKRPDSPIVNWSSSEVARALYNGYEVEFKEGDWVYNRIIDKVAQIDERYDAGYNLWVDDEEFNFYFMKDSRHATGSEIEEEKERRFWARNGRNVWGLKRGDIIYDKSEPYAGVVEKIHGDAGGEVLVIFKDGFWEFYNNVIEKYNVVCFAENQLDGETNDE